MVSVALLTPLELRTRRRDAQVRHSMGKCTARILLCLSNSDDNFCFHVHLQSLVRKSYNQLNAALDAWKVLPSQTSMHMVDAANCNAKLPAYLCMIGTNVSKYADRG